MPLDVNVSKDGLTYIVDLTDINGQKIEALLTEDPDGWLLHNYEPPISHRVGRRKHWYAALADALAWMEAQLKARE